MFFSKCVNDVFFFEIGFSLSIYKGIIDVNGLLLLKNVLPISLQSQLWFIITCFNLCQGWYWSSTQTCMIILHLEKIWRRNFFTVMICRTRIVRIQKHQVKWTGFRRILFEQHRRCWTVNREVFFLVELWYHIIYVFFVYFYSYK